MTTPTTSLHRPQVGHSFGAATVAIACRRVGAPAVVLLDPWAFSLAPEEVARGVSPASLCVLCEAWLESEERHAIDALLGSSPGIVSLYAPHTRHQSVSDTSTWAPRLVSERMGGVGKGEAPHAVRTADENGLILLPRRDECQSSVVGATCDGRGLPRPLLACRRGGDGRRCRRGGLTGLPRWAKPPRQPRGIRLLDCPARGCAGAMKYK